MGADRVGDGRTGPLWARSARLKIFSRSGGDRAHPSRRARKRASKEIHELAKRDFGLRRHWHKRVVTSRSQHGPDLPRRAARPPLGRRRVVYLDFGPLFEEWEADYGRTYVLGNDPLKHKLVADIETAFKRGKQRSWRTPG